MSTTGQASRKEGPSHPKTWELAVDNLRYVRVERLGENKGPGYQVSIHVQVRQAYLPVRNGKEKRIWTLNTET